MAEERNLGVARAADADDTDYTKAELQRRMEEARESITQTVTEIKDTVANQYQAVRDTVSEALDWREQYRKRPVAFSIGALSAGFILGYSVGGVIKGDSDYDEDYDYPTYEESDAFATTGAVPEKLSASSYEEGTRALRRPSGSSQKASLPSAQPAMSSGSMAYEKAAPVEADYSTPEETTEPDKPGLIERFKETKAYDRLQQEVSVLGDRFIEELSNVGQTVVLPMLFSKVKELFGVDLSNKDRGAKGASAGTQSAAGGGASARASSGPAAGAASTSASGVGGGSGSSYATSENRPYQTPSTESA